MKGLTFLNAQLSQVEMGVQGRADCVGGLECGGCCRNSQVWRVPIKLRWKSISASIHNRCSDGTLSALRFTIEAPMTPPGQ